MPAAVQIVDGAPPEIVRRTLVHKSNRIAQGLSMRDRADLTRSERDDTVALPRPRSRRRGRRAKYAKRPTPLDEVRSGLIIFEQSLWDALPQYSRSVDRALCASTGRPLPISDKATTRVMRSPSAAVRSRATVPRCPPRSSSATRSRGLQ